MHMAHVANDEGNFVLMPSEIPPPPVLLSMTFHQEAFRGIEKCIRRVADLPLAMII
ncbi:MAG TPA: hypothetical protein VGO47_01435 [Chlamydiales bacterium]|nr:hypothetical protein [Chlamydiales bacterium]